MSSQNEQLDALRDIRSMMERSSRFISLSGLSGVIAGFTALTGVALLFAYFRVNPLQSIQFMENDPSNTIHHSSGLSGILFIVADAVIVLIVSILAACFLAKRKAKKLNLSFWDATSKRLVLNLAIPLLAGGIFCIALVYHGYYHLIAASMLIFYGLALLNASKYTLNEIRYLGILEITTGLMASFVVGYSLLFWAFGFGVLHIVYGVVLYNKYEK